MRLRSERPASLQRFRRIGGVVEHWFFEAAPDDHATRIKAIAAALADAPEAAIERLPHGPVDRGAFLGRWCDPETWALIKVGRWRTQDGETLENPTLRDVGRRPIVSGGYALTEPGANLGYAYAFSNPPYPLRAAPAEIDNLFRKVLPSFMPVHAQTRIVDWCSPELCEASPYFAAGAEWWGVFLYTVAIPAEQRLCVIMASATD